MSAAKPMNDSERQAWQRAHELFPSALIVLACAAVVLVLAWLPWWRSWEIAQVGNRWPMVVLGFVVMAGVVAGNLWKVRRWL